MAQERGAGTGERLVFRNGQRREGCCTAQMHARAARARWGAQPGRMATGWRVRAESSSPLCHSTPSEKHSRKRQSCQKTINYSRPSTHHHLWALTTRTVHAQLHTFSLSFVSFLAQTSRCLAGEHSHAHTQYCTGKHTQRYCTRPLSTPA